MFVHNQPFKIWVAWGRRLVMIMLHLYIPRYPDFERVVVYRHTLPLHLPKPPGQRQQQEQAATAAR